ncbi:RNA polymerase sigma-70 factor [Aliifodinibius sp. S!AR15-10]|uniref:RNA polymerase sigma factor n=1 Tax=Aliifodinibius sp. S!AR15-10 TaxID=2950437 RepID=UPI00285E3532|nr:RNA polymerase sigma-70 factor [Aliifodinibius sp. S!AR15-10]MDR8393579.1 RNA polymerase sigma-70 factor [Aliifodinibius sp. S!AR15-10]
MRTALNHKFENPDHWVEQIRNGNKEAFEKLFQEYYDDLHRFVWGYIGREDIAEELVQDVFVKVWKTRHKLDPQQKIKSYLYRIARNLAIDYLRHRSTVREWEDEKKALHRFSNNPTFLDDDLDKQMKLEDVKAAIQELPERRRLIFVLSRFNRLTYKEIGETLDISVNTVETQIVRALKTLRKKFSSLSEK